MKMGKRASINDPPQGEVLAAMPTAAEMELLERKQIEMALRESEARLRQITDNMLDIIRQTDVKGIIQYASPSHKTILGYLPEELIDKSIIDFVHPDDVEKVLGLCRLGYKSSTSGKAEYRTRHAAGHYIWVETVGNLLSDETGHITGAIFCLRDISERKKSEAALRLSEHKFSQAFRCNPDSTSISTLIDGRYFEVNDAYLTSTGYERHELIGHTASELGIWTVPGERDNILREIQEHGSVSGYETTFRMKSGIIRTSLLSAEIIQMGDEPMLLCVARNITERKKMEEALRLSEERFSQAFNASPIMMCITTIEEGTFIDVNDSFCRGTGFSREEVLGRNSLDIGIWGDKVNRLLVKKRLLERKSVRDLKCDFRKKSGDLRTGLYSAEILAIEGEKWLLSMLSDTTDQKQMEIEITRLDRLNLVSEIAASIGHEIRNPMTAVRGFLQLFEEKYIEDKEFLDLMIEEMDRANAIITEFLSLARNKAVELKTMNLKSIITNILPLVQANAMIQDKVIKLDMDDIPDLLLDEKEIRQLILNLISNGLESMPVGGELTIRTFVENTHLILSVEDQGSGIAPGIIDKLGTPFLSTKDNGTGLGLAVCYGIANHHKATIDIDTSPAGTTFKVIFPLLTE